jgi:hypothetical protein
VTATDIVHARLFELKTAHAKWPRSDRNAEILKHRIDEASEILSRLEKYEREWKTSLGITKAEG